MNIALYVPLVRRWLMLACLPTLAVMGVAYLYFAAQPRLYSTTAVLYVQQPVSNASMSVTTDVVTSQELIPTYSEMIQTPVIQQAVNRAMTVRYPGYTLQDHDLSVTRAGVLPGSGQDNTQLMDIAVSDTVPARAADGANTLARVFVGQITELQKMRYRGGALTLRRQLDRAQTKIQDLSRRIETYVGPPDGRDILRTQLNAYQNTLGGILASQQAFNMERHIALNSVRVFSSAPIPLVPAGPHPARNSVLWGFFALVTLTGGVFLLDQVDDTPRTPEEVEELLDARVLGTVPKFGPDKDGRPILGSGSLSGAVEEAYLTIRTNVEFAQVEEPLRSVLVTSPSTAEGKSITISSLACAFAGQGRRVALVDADLRRPVLHQIFNLDPSVGLTTVLAGAEIPTGRGGGSPEVDDLSVIAAGPLPARPPDLLGSPRMREFLRYLSTQTDIILIDSPPVLAVTDAAILSTMVNGVVLVVDPAISTRREIERARAAIEAVGGRILGVVLNRLSDRRTAYGESYRGHVDYNRWRMGSDETEPQRLEA